MEKKGDTLYRYSGKYTSTFDWKGREFLLSKVVQCGGLPVQDNRIVKIAEVRQLVKIIAQTPLTNDQHEVYKRDIINAAAVRFFSQFCSVKIDLATAPEGFPRGSSDFFGNLLQGGKMRRYADKLYFHPMNILRSNNLLNGETRQVIYINHKRLRLFSEKFQLKVKI